MSRREPTPIADVPAGAPVYWRSLDERSDPDALLARSAREFSDGASELSDPVSRRAFLSLVGGTVALAGMGLEGCARRPVDHIVPYARVPEGVIPGIPQHYATVIARRGEALGLIVESHEGRPTKVEGNPDHPASLGGADILAQASVLDLYDPDRSRAPLHRDGGHAHEQTFAQFHDAFVERLQTHERDGGEQLRILAEPSNSPTFLRMRDAVMSRFPHAHFHTYTPVNEGNIRRGGTIAFGRAVQAHYGYDRARVILSLDCDFLQTEAGSVRATKLFANGRRLRSTSDEMNRLYVVESTHSTTGANADHRLRLPSRDVLGYLAALMNELATTHRLPFEGLAAALARVSRPSVPEHWIQAVAADLARNRRGSIVCAGSRQPAIVHALVHALNRALDNVDETVSYTPTADTAEPDDQGADLQTLVQAMNDRRVGTLVILGGNPVYSAPGSLDFAAKLANVEVSVHLSMFRDETSEHCTWHAPRAHELETWGDQRSLDGTVSVQQPLVSPLFNGHSEIETLAILANDPERRGRDLVRTTMRGGRPAGSPLGSAPERGGVMGAIATSDRDWRRMLHVGLAQGTAWVPLHVTPRYDEIATQLQGRPEARALGRENVEVVFAACPKMLDGRHANNSWLMELPDPETKIVWDNAAYISPATATALGAQNGAVLRVSKGNRNVEVPAWILPGHADWSVTLTLGWGRRARALWIANGKGVDVNPVRSHEAMSFEDGFTVATAGRQYELVQTQEHHAMENRPIALEATLEEYREVPNFAERRSPTPRTLPLWREVNYTGHKWAMTIDLNACTGCNACAVACQAENNVPVVGKDQVNRGREMAWLRIDRYYLGGLDDPKVMHQPVACVQCEEAPCENVCPVNATTHTPEGLNDMVYNRCIGTRYCSNNCPYKVRRFNYLNWHNDGAWRGAGIAGTEMPETVRMQHNPNVTVRFRGVMEKCTYCVQRIQMARIAVRRENREMRDADVKPPACAQSCPADAIVFGDLNDRTSRIAQAWRTDRRYALLGEIGTQPRTTYLAKVRNPNSEMHG